MNTDRPENDDARAEAEALRAENGTVGETPARPPAGTGSQSPAGPTGQGDAAGGAGAADGDVPAGADGTPGGERAADATGAAAKGGTADATGTPGAERAADVTGTPAKGRVAGAGAVPAEGVPASTADATGESGPAGAGDASGEAGPVGAGDASGEAGPVGAGEGRAVGVADASGESGPVGAADATGESGPAGAGDASGEGRAVGAADVTAGGDDGVLVGAAPGSRRPRRAGAPWAVGIVAAAVLVVGGGGAYLAGGASGGSGGGTTGSEASGGHGTPPPLALDGYSSGGTNGIAPGEPNPYGASYRAGGTLPGGPGSAAVYRARGEVTRDEVARLARALGVDGTPVAGAQAWTVGTGKDGGGPVLRVNRLAPGTWTFSRYAPGTDNCKGVLCTHDPAAPAANPVSAAAAEKAAAPVLKALGQDDAKVDASQIMGAQRIVNADPVIGGLPTYGWTTGLTVGAQGEVVGGSGQLKAPVKGDTYPVLSAGTTLDLMNAAPRTDHRMGIGGCTVPEPPKDRLEAPCGTSPSGSAGTGGDAFTVDKAVFGLASHYSGGRQLLVPSWLFHVRGVDGGGSGGFTVTYPALDPKYLASSAPSGQPTQPTPAPSGSAGAPVTEDVKVSGYSTSGDELTVAFEGGVCSDYRASVREGQDRVTVTVTEKRWPDRVCIAIAKEFRQSVHLDRPLGDRKVVGSDGQAIPRVKPGARLPQTPPLAR